ncbi:penicillin-binding protein activator [bacterium]|nr:penicillin-binding protein activator [candidate division CSSED10-310 bacterium]
MTYSRVFSFIMCMVTFVCLLAACGPPRVLRDQTATGITLYEQGALDEARVILEESVRAYPDKPPSDHAMFVLSLIAAERGDFSQQERWCRRLDGAFPDSRYRQPCMLELARNLLKGPAPEAAANLLLKLLNTDDRMVRQDALDLLAGYHESRGDLHRAADFHDQAAGLMLAGLPRALRQAHASRLYELAGEPAAALRMEVRAIDDGAAGEPDWLAGEILRAGDLYIVNGQLFQALETYARGLRLAANPQLLHNLRRHLQRALLQLDQPSRELLEARHTGDLIGAELALIKAQTLADADEFDAAAEILMKLLQDFPDDEISTQAGQELFVVQSELAVDAQRIGVLLPLSGQLSVFGRAALHGIQLAQVQAGDKRQSFILLPMDTHGDAGEAAKAAEQLIVEEHVVAIIGPLLSRCVRGVIPVAERYHTPVFTPGAADPGIPGESKLLFRNCVTSASEGKVIARFAHDTLGITTCAILYPDNAYGRDLSEIFTGEFETAGGDIVAAQQYAEGETDFRQAILAVKPHPFEGLFIPDYAPTVGLLAPQLPFHEIMDAVLLGTSGWNAPELLDIGGRYVEGAFFTEPFFKGDSYPPIQTFAMNYQRMFLEPPSLISAQAYEAASILLGIVGESCASRHCVARRLAETPEFTGLSGPLVNTPDGDLDREIAILLVNHGALEEFRERAASTPAPHVTMLAREPAGF